MNISNMFVSRHHPAALAYGCVTVIIPLVLLISFKLTHDYMQRSSRRKYARLCKFCLQRTRRQHVKTKLSPDRSGSFLRRLVSAYDYLCQTHATCFDPDCRGHETYVEEGKEYVRPFGLRGRLFRWREFRNTVTKEGLIETPFVRMVFSIREPKSKQSGAKIVFRPRGLDKLPIEIKPEIPDIRIIPRKVR